MNETSRLPFASSDRIVRDSPCGGVITRATGTIGHGAAGYTQIVTKSGSDQIHGSVFEFLQNDNLNANNFFATDTTGTKLPATIVPARDGNFAC